MPAKAQTPTPLNKHRGTAMVLRSEILVNKNGMPTADQALPGRDTPMSLPELHYDKCMHLAGP